MFRLFHRLRVFYKSIKRKFLLIPSFCKECGRDNADFVVPDEVWEQVKPHIKYGHVLCYDCFCRKCEELGLPPVWKLKEL